MTDEPGLSDVPARVAQDAASPLERPMVVGLGASAGGLEALDHFFSHLPSDPGLAFVVVQHLDPTHESLMPELLSKCTTLHVEKAHDRQPVEPNRVYVIPPNAVLTIERGRLRLSTPAAPRGQRNPIDVFFRALGRDLRGGAVGVIMSGTGTDGTIGLGAIKENGGLTVAQEPSTAKYDSMPRSAIDAGYIDHVLPVELMPATILEYARHMVVLKSHGGDVPARESVQAICAMLRQRTGHDFSHYKRSTLLRRIRRRLQVRAVVSAEAYLRLLDEDPREVHHLLQDLLIGVTQFFRDPEAFDALARLAVDPLLAEANRTEPIRVWVVGCATGEEAYSLAMLLREKAAGRARGTQIFASDIDEAALEIARRGTYPQGISEHVSPARLQRYFVRVGDSYQVTKELRETCVFSAHDLIRDPPFSRMDLICCRNVLIYIEGEMQKKILPLLHYALRPGGLLFLGPSENVTGRPELFEVLDKKARIFRRRETFSERLLEFPVGQPVSRGQRAARTPSIRQSHGEIAQRLVLQEFAPAAALVTAEGEVLHVTGRTGRFLELPAGPFENSILTMTRRELRLSLRAALQQASRNAMRAENGPVRLESPEGETLVRIVVRPVEPRPKEPPLFLVVFADCPAEQAHAESGEPGDVSLVQQLEAELGRAKEDLQSTIEQLETSNEELKSSNEELLSMNEELQSTNEELQTSKEELQSTNEELHTVNAELKRKVDELDRARDDMVNLFRASPVATVFLDSELRVQSYTPAAQEIIRLRESDIGRPVTDLQVPIEDPAWLEDVHEVLRTLAPRARELSVLQGHAVAWYILRVTPYRTANNRIEGVVLSFSDVTELKLAQLKSEELAEVVASAHDAIVRRSWDETVLSWNRGAEEIFGYRREEMFGQSFARLVPEARRNDLDALLERLKQGETIEAVETELLHKSGERVQVSLALTLTRDAQGRPNGIATIVRDDTRRKRAEEERAHLAHQLAERVAELQTILDLAPIGIAVTTEPSGERIIGNRACEGILGVRVGANLCYGPERASELPFRVYRDGVEVAPAEQPLQASASRGEVTTGQLYEYRFADGRLKHVQVSSVPLHDDAGRIRGAVAAMVDLTERRRIEAELKVAARQKDEFITLLAHELRNPMAAIAMALEVLVRKDAVTAAGHNSLGVLRRQIAMLGNLVDEMLDVSRIARQKIELHPEPVDLSQLGAEATEDQRRLAEQRQLKLTFASVQGPVWVSGDRVRLIQVVGNLLSNAIKFTRAGGTVSLSVDRDGEGRARIVVSDTGIGISQHTLTAIFEPFRRDARRGPGAHEGGLGLGLALSKGLVELHGGSIEAHSDGPEKGAVFTVTLPTVRAPAVAAREIEETARVRRRVLVVEDGEDLAASLRELLEGRGHQVAVAHDGREALSTARDLLPEVVICDIGLPGDLDGCAVARALRADPKLQGTYLVALTGFASEADRTLASQAGFDVHLAKPPNLAELERLVAQAGSSAF